MVYGDRFGDEPPDWYVEKEVADWLRIPVMAARRVPIRYWDRAIIALNAKADAAEQRNQDRQEREAIARGEWSD